MPEATDHKQALVVGNRLYEVRWPSSDARYSTVEVSLDRALPWTFAAAMWRGISFGSSGNVAYLWSADRFVVLPDTPSATVEAFDPDEDLLVVFSAGDRWLLVCESSLRVLVGLREVQRLELPDVVVKASWAGSELLIRLFGDIGYEFVLEGESLRLRDEL